MTSDEQFLRENHIEPCEIKLPNWMTWRDTEMDNLRLDNAVIKDALRQSNKERQQWRVGCLIAGLFALWLMVMPVINRLGQ